jgi:hypothetical protein
MDRQIFITNYDKFFEIALKNLLENNDYQTARPIERHRMLMNELENLYFLDNPFLLSSAVDD